MVAGGAEAPPATFGSDDQRRRDVSSSSRFTRMATTITQGLVALLLVAALVVPEALSFAQTESEHQLQNLSGRVGSSGAAFRIKGVVKGLFPGKRKIMKVKLRNPNRFPIVVKELKIRVRPSNKLGCASKWIKVRKRLRVSVRVPARGRAKRSVPVKLKPRAPRSCQGARWRLKFRGGAVRKR